MAAPFVLSVETLLADLAKPAVKAALEQNLQLPQRLDDVAAEAARSAAEALVEYLSTSAGRTVLELALALNIRLSDAAAGGAGAAISEIRSGVAAEFNTLAKIATMLSEVTRVNNLVTDVGKATVVSAIESGLNLPTRLTNTANAAIDAIRGGVASDFDTLAEIAAVIARLVRVDVQAFTAAERKQARTNIGLGSERGRRNRIINGQGRINQANVTSAADDIYGHDMHYALTQTAALNLSSLGGAEPMIRLTQPQATAQRIGYAQIIEAAETVDLRGQVVQLGGRLRCSASQPIRFAVLEWTGTADTVTSDVVNSWTSSSYTAGGFFIAGVNVLATGAITPAAGVITDWRLPATVGAAANNLIVLYWTQGTAAQNLTLDQRWYLVDGDISDAADPLAMRHIAEEQMLCRRHFWRVDGITYIGAGHVQNVTSAYVIIQLPWAMRAAPAFTYGGSIGLGVGGADPTVTAVALSRTSPDTVVLSMTSADLVAGQACAASLQADAYFNFDARL